MSNLPSRVSITESSSRDGLQSLGVTIPTQSKIDLIEALADTGLRSFDAVSFVSPKAVPQMADGPRSWPVLEGRDDLELWGLVPNMKGLESALKAGLTKIGLLTAASDTFSQRNINATVDESMHRIRRIITEAPGGAELPRLRLHSHPLPVRG